MNLSDMKVIAGLPQMVGRATPCAPGYMNVNALELKHRIHGRAGSPLRAGTSRGFYISMV